MEELLLQLFLYAGYGLIEKHKVPLGVLGPMF